MSYSGANSTGASQNAGPNPVDKYIEFAYDLFRTGTDVVDALQGRPRRRLPADLFPDRAQAFTPLVGPRPESPDVSRSEVDSVVRGTEEAMSQAVKQFEPEPYQPKTEPGPTRITVEPYQPKTVEEAEAMGYRVLTDATGRLTGYIKPDGTQVMLTQ